MFSHSRVAFAVLILASTLTAPAIAQRPAEGLTGTGVVRLDSTAVRNSGSRTLAEFLAGRVAGLNVTYATGATGYAPEVNARGSAGALGSGRPLLYVDGVLQREDAHQLGPDLDRVRPSHGWSLPLDEIEDIEVHLGPTSGAMLAFGASRGAVMVRTRGGTATRQVVGSIDVLAMAPPGTLPTRVTTSGTTLTGTTDYCPLTDQATGFCAPGPQRRFAPFGGAQPFQTGVSTRATMRASGPGVGPLATYRAAATLDEGAGNVRESGFQRLDLALRAESHAIAGVRFNADARFARTDGKYTPASENGLYQTGLLGYSKTDSTLALTQRVADSVLARSRPYTVDRLTLGLGARAALPFGLALRTQLAHDRTIRTSALEERLYRLGDDSLVARRNTRNDLRQGGTSASAAIRGGRTFTSWLRVESEVGAQLENLDINESAERITVTSGGETVTTGRLIPDVRTRSTYGALRASLGAGRSVGGGLRKESTEFGRLSLGRDPLASLDAGWTVSSERFFPQTPWLETLHLRAGYGESNDLQPTLELARFGPLTAVSPQALPPTFERTTERTFGADLSWLDGALTVSGTGYGRYVRDGVLVIAAPDGADAFGGNSWSTVGEEWTVQLRDRTWLGARWGLRASFSRTRTEITSMREGPQSRALSIAARSRYRTGVPFGAVFTSGYTFTDTNTDGIIDVREIVIDTGATFRGMTQPREIYGLSVDARWAKGWSAGATVDAKVGQIKIDQTQALTCIWLVCPDLYDRNASLPRQARAVVLGYGPNQTGPTFDADFIRLRELWVRYDVPSRFVPNALQSARVTLAAQHLATWTRYPGGDPETGSFSTPTVQRGDIYSPPLTRAFSVRLDLVP